MNDYLISRKTGDLPELAAQPARKHLDWHKCRLAAGRRRRSEGVALVIALAFIVLLTGLIVAFFSRTVTNRQISNASASQMRVDLLAHGALDAVVADLKQEIAAGSTKVGSASFVPPNSLPAGQTLYLPNDQTTMKPSRVAITNAGGSGNEPGLLNVIKRSAYNQPFYPAANRDGNATSRAANVSTEGVSLNGHKISPSRWNKPLFMEQLAAVKTDPTDMTPAGGPAPGSTTAWNNAPQWVLVARNGANPGGNGSAAPVSGASSISDPAPANGNFVVGRYAYFIYNQGGLFDMNAAGFPKTSYPDKAAITVPKQEFKDSIAFTDLSQVTTSSGQASMDLALNAIVGWRNFVSLGTTWGTTPAFQTADSPQLSNTGSNGLAYTFPPAVGANYYDYVWRNTTGYLRPANAVLAITPIRSTPLSDRIFSSRQQLIQMLIQGVATTAAQRADYQTALPYLSTFSRDLNQPTLWPQYTDSSKWNYRPSLVPESSGGNNKTQASYPKINPPFLTVRAPAAFNAPNPAGSTTTIRASDASAPNAGEPLVKYRFPLNRLAWLTFRGPIATSGGVLSSDSDIKIIISKLLADGFSDEFLRRGTPENIFASFGLTWDASKQRWIYRYNPSNPGPIARFDTLAAGTAPGGRGVSEPDFFELLKASIATGGLGKAATKPPASTGAQQHPYDYQHIRDVDTDRHIMQIGANIIDQYDYDGYATRIVFDNGVPTEIRGVENVPYLYRLRTGTFIARNPVPVNGALASTPPPKEQFDSGFGMLMHIPELWNPHDYNSPLGQPRPTNFRIAVDSTAPPFVPDPMSVEKSKDHTPGDNDLSAYNIMGTRTRNDGSVNSGYLSTGATTLSGTYKFTTGPLGSGRELSYTTSEPSRAIWSGSVSDDKKVSTLFNFVINTTGTTSKLFREPTMMAKVGYPKIGSEDSNFTGPDYSSDPYLGTSTLRNAAGQPVFNKVGLGGGFLGEGVKPLNPVDTGSSPITGVVVGIFPCRWVANANKKLYGGDEVQLNVAGAGADSSGQPQAYLTYRVQYQDPKAGWITYDEKYTEVPCDFVMAPVTDKSEQPMGGFIQSGGPFIDRPSWPQLVSVPKNIDSSSYAHLRDPGFAWQNWVDTAHQPFCRGNVQPYSIDVLDRQLEICAGREYRRLAG